MYLEGVLVAVELAELTDNAVELVLLDGFALLGPFAEDNDGPWPCAWGVLSLATADPACLLLCCCLCCCCWNCCYALCFCFRFCFRMPRIRRVTTTTGVGHELLRTAHCAIGGPTAFFSHSLAGARCTHLN